MKTRSLFSWNDEKNDKLIRDRNISFEDILSAIESGWLLADELHKNQEKYPWQRVMFVRHNEYVFQVPYVENDDWIFLKTIFPSWQAKRRFLNI